MGALLSQAVADQLRQFPGSQDPRPSPPALLQQVLNPPGPSRPMWMAPVMENQQLMTTGMDPNLSPEYRQAIQQAMAQDALKTVMAFGGADITKEQRLQWEKENAAYRAQQFGKELPGSPESFPPGTRVYMRTEESQPTAKKGYWIPGGHGVVVDPRDPKAGIPGDTRFNPRWGLEPPGEDYVAVRHPDSQYWFWRHRDQLEMLPPPEEFPVGGEVQYRDRHHGGRIYDAVVTEPPRDASRRPSPDYVWLDVIKGEPHGESGVKRYSNELWGAWFHRSDLLKKK